MPRKKVLKYGSERQYQKIKNNFWYLVIIRKLPDRRDIIPRYIQELEFDTYGDYIKFRNRHPKMFYDFFIVPTKGKQIKEYKIRRKKMLRTWGLFMRDKTKYDYPSERISLQDRKSMRTKIRRQKRDWGYSLDKKFI